MAIRYRIFLESRAGIFREYFILVAYIERDKTVHNVTASRQEKLAEMIHLIKLLSNAGEESIKCNYIILGKCSDRYLSYMESYEQ